MHNLVIFLSIFELTFYGFPGKGSGFSYLLKICLSSVGEFLKVSLGIGSCGQTFGNDEDLLRALPQFYRLRQLRFSGQKGTF